MTTIDIVLAILCNGIACILGLIWVIQGKPKGSKMIFAAIMAWGFWFAVGFAVRLAAVFMHGAGR